MITVSSCDIHNTQKSKDDEFFHLALVGAFQGNSTKQEHFDTKVKGAISRKPHVTRALVEKFKPILRATEDDGSEKLVAVTIDKLRLNRCIEHTVSGIYYHHFKEKWEGELRIISNILFDTTSSNAESVNKKI